MFNTFRPSLRRAGATTAAALAVALVVTGIAGASASAAATKIPAKTARFCSAWAASDQIGATADTNSPEGIKAFAAELLPFLVAIEKTAPAEVSTQLPALRNAVTAAASGDVDAFNGDDFGAANSRVEGFVHDNCGFQQVDVGGIDFAFQGIPKKLKAGTTSFEFTNKSTMDEFHVLVVVKEKKGVHLSPKALLSGSQDDLMKKADVIAATAAGPGQVGGVVGKLTPGTYVAFCPVPVGGVDTGDPHFVRGMVTGFTVK